MLASRTPATAGSFPQRSWGHPKEFKFARPHRLSRAQKNDTSSGSTPLDLLQQLGQEQGFVVEVDDTGDEEDAETWEEAMDEMEDPWMREPSGESFAELGMSSDVAPANEAARKAVPLITADEFDAMISDDSHVLVVLDIRSKDEYKQGHLPMAQHVPLQHLSADAAKQWQLKTVVVVGSSDSRSQQACIRLSQVFQIQSVFHLVQPS
ncbi:hypothetical protein ABBQ32_011383 [Trebouxia sp. C0010 RCD-2024]